MVRRLLILMLLLPLSCFADDPMDIEGFNYSKKKPFDEHHVLPSPHPGRYPSSYRRNMKENRPLLPSDQKSQIKYNRRR